MKNIVLSVLSAILFFIGLSYARKAPDFQMEDLNGKIIKRDDLKGKPTVLIFWQVYCHSCKDELPKMSKLAKEYKGKVNFYAVVILTRDIPLIEETRRKWGFDLPILLGDSLIMRKYKIIGTPITYILDKDLNIVKVLYGRQKEEKIRKILNGLIRNKH